jgi:hypothetical protein
MPADIRRLEYAHKEPPEGAAENIAPLVSVQRDSYPQETATFGKFR